MDAETATRIDTNFFRFSAVPFSALFAHVRETKSFYCISAK
jgi:hypothetical protein